MHGVCAARSTRLRRARRGRGVEPAALLLLSRGRLLGELHGGRRHGAARSDELRGGRGQRGGAHGGLGWQAQHGGADTTDA